MRRQFSLLVLALLVSIAVPAAQATQAADEDKLVGKWSGTFDGDSSGSYSMAIERDAAKKLVGTLQTSPAGGDGYSATFKRIVVEGAKATLAYDAPNVDAIEIQIDAALEADGLRGTWKVVETPSKQVVQSGSLVGKKG